MKKIIFGLILLFAFAIPVFALDNKLYLTESDNKIYYDTSLFDSTKFMYHIDMVPGGNYTDELVIENAAGFPLTVYLKVKDQEQSAAAEELLDNISMKVYLNDSMIYDGKVKGLDYNLNGINLQDSVLLKKMSNKEQAKISVELSLSEEYSNKEFNDFSYLNWVFIAEFDKQFTPDPEPTPEPEPQPETHVVEIVPAPITGLDYNYVPVVIASIGVCTVACILIIFIKKRKNENK